MFIFKKFLLIAAVGLLASCSSSSQKNANKKYGNVVQVDVQDNRAQSSASVDQKKEFQKIFTQKKSWFKMQDGTERLRYYKNMSLPQLESQLQGANPEKTTIILEVLGQKGAAGVRLIVKTLTDKRHAVFAVSKPLFWYEKKNKPAEPMEIRVYAAFLLESVLKTNPSGVFFDFHKIQTSDKGAVDVLYAVRGDYAVNKEDACKAWLSWWEKFKTDY